MKLKPIIQTTKANSIALNLTCRAIINPQKSLNFVYRYTCGILNILVC